MVSGCSLPNPTREASGQMRQMCDVDVTVRSQEVRGELPSSTAETISSLLLTPDSSPVA